MRAVNVLLSLLVSLLLVALVLEGGLRLLGFGPSNRETIHRFDPQLGWSKEPGAVGVTTTSEFEVTYRVNELGLRDDPMPSPAKPEGAFRVLMLGDSFVHGSTVDREDLFVDLLERRWDAGSRAAGGPPVDVVNAGTEGWSTDQEVLWFELHGADFQPDLVLLLPYENDLYWSSQVRYHRFPKPRYNSTGEPERRVLSDPGPLPASQRFALGKFYGLLTTTEPTWSPPGSERRLFMEWGAFFHDTPPHMEEALRRVRGALLALRERCAELGSELVVAPIPGKAAVQEPAREHLVARVGVDPTTWSPEQPVETFLALADELGIPALDAREALRAAAAEGDLYYERDWHFDPRGNRAFADFLHAELGARGLLPPAAAAAPPRAEDRERREPEDGLPGWLPLLAGLWLALGGLYAWTYRREESPLFGFLKVGALLATVFAIAIGGTTLAGALPAGPRSAALALFVLAVLGFIAWKLGRRLGTIAELLVSFVARGHWYLLPLVVVLLTVGSLLVVAASSPLIAPFIYTLF